MDVSEIFNRVTSRYSECRTYSDRGTVTWWDPRDNRPAKPQQIFETQFIAPSSLRYIFETGPDRLYGTASQSVIQCAT